MKKLLIFLVLILAAISVYWFLLRKKESRSKPPKQASLALKTHSDKFNAQVDSVIYYYLALKNAFVESDTTTAKRNASLMIDALDKVPLDELKKDTASIYETALASVNDIKSNAQSLLQQKDITEMRRDFSMVTEMMYPSFFRSINYEGPVLYVENCPMAFGDDAPANWISSSSEVVNPYLGKIHPQYKATMLHCGEVKDSIMAKK